MIKIKKFKPKLFSIKLLMKIMDDIRLNIFIKDSHVTLIFQ